MLTFKKSLIGLCLLFLFAAVALADPVRITSGTVNNSGINISGQNVSYNLGTVNGVPIETFSAFGFRPGTTLTPSIQVFNFQGVPGATLNQNYIGGALINGVSYFGQFGSGVIGQNTMLFTPLQSITLPSIFPPPPTTGGFATFTVSIPFTMIGTLQGQGCPAASPCTNIPLVSMYGNGTATYTFQAWDSFDGTWKLSRYSFEFSASPTPDPVPEPATILLFSSGIAGLAGYAARRRKKKA
jgi:hypothetical protein